WRPCRSRCASGSLPAFAPTRTSSSVRRRQAPASVAYSWSCSSSCWVPDLRSCRRAWLRHASLVQEHGDLPGYSLEFVDLAVGGDEVREGSASIGAFLLETPAFARGCLARFLLRALAGKGF